MVKRLVGSKSHAKTIGGGGDGKLGNIYVGGLATKVAQWREIFLRSCRHCKQNHGVLAHGCTNGRISVMADWIQNNLFDWTNGMEWLGLLAAALVLVSFLMKDERAIRIVNIVGAAVFVVYGLCIKSASVWVMNCALVVVHIVRLTKIRNSQGNNADNGNTATDKGNCGNNGECDDGAK